MTMNELHPDSDPASSAKEAADVVYQESATLTIIGGFMVVYEDRCRITMNAHLSAEDKAYGRQQMLKHRQALQAQIGGVYVWDATLDNRDNP